MISPRRGDLSGRLAATSAGYLLDRIVGEPPDPVHPLRAFGLLMANIEGRFFADDRLAGIAYTTSGIGTGLLAGLVVRSTSGASFLTCGGKALAGAASAVDGALLREDLETARVTVRALVGRDTELLGEDEIARAAVESVAENTVDAIVAPLFFAAVAGAPGALGYRAANTLDALVGYRNARYAHFGWASARLDDALNFVPARLTALLVALVRPRRAREVLRAVRRDAHAHPSPNAGVAESAFAAALGRRLGGTSTYGGIAESRAFLGDGCAPERTDIARAVRLSQDVGDAAAIGSLVAALLLRARFRVRASIASATR